MTIYLYKKVHLKTGLQYLGVTTQSDPHAYTGSGVLWKRHLKKNGYNYSTEILLESSSKEEIKKVGLYYSNLWNIVEDDSWANLMPEAGEIYMTPITAKKISETKKGRPAHNKGLNQQHKKHKPRSDKGSTRKGYSYDHSPLKGRKRPRIDCPYCGKNIDNVNYYRYHGEKCKHRP